MCVCCVHCIYSICSMHCMQASTLRTRKFVRADFELNSLHCWRLARSSLVALFHSFSPLSSSSSFSTHSNHELHAVCVLSFCFFIMLVKLKAKSKIVCACAFVQILQIFVSAWNERKPDWFAVGLAAATLKNVSQNTFFCRSRITIKRVLIYQSEFDCFFFPFVSVWMK